jgi:hypothetical protein
MCFFRFFSDFLFILVAEIRIEIFLSQLFSDGLSVETP